jgi:D-alanyl-D-alanine carboxypeptidase (penicillin-binding protein 5/6)
LNIYVAGELKKKIDVLSGEEIKKANIFSRLLKSFNFLVWGNV